MHGIIEITITTMTVEYLNVYLLHSFVHPDERLTCNIKLHMKYDWTAISINIHWEIPIRPYDMAMTKVEMESIIPELPV